jgi:hypothetical protein
LAIFYSDRVIATLEAHDPRRVLSNRNIAPLITFIEEIVHAVQAALCYLEGHRHFASEDFARSMEAQAKVDTYLVLCKMAQWLCGTPLPGHVSAWLEGAVFDDSASRESCPVLRARYALAQAIAHQFTRTLRTVAVPQRHAILRQFRQATWHEKQARVRRLPTEPTTHAPSSAA